MHSQRVSQLREILPREPKKRDDKGCANCDKPPMNEAMKGRPPIEQRVFSAKFIAVSKWVWGRGREPGFNARPPRTDPSDRN